MPHVAAAAAAATAATALPERSNKSRKSCISKGSCGWQLRTVCGAVLLPCVLATMILAILQDLLAEQAAV